ncbi:hypothetical protein Tcan_01045, partial [Toxocara canis]
MTTAASTFIPFSFHRCAPKTPHYFQTITALRLTLRPKYLTGERQQTQIRPLTSTNKLSFVRANLFNRRKIFRMSYQPLVDNSRTENVEKRFSVALKLKVIPSPLCNITFKRMHWSTTK